jgi:UDP-N-acetylglucosamine 1-carboxyvinyltransferase
MEKFLIKGGKKLEGSATITSSKNAYLPILAGCILSDEKIVLRNCPKYSDIINMIKILKSLGGEITADKIDEDGEISNGCNLLIDCSNLHSNAIPHELASVIRSSIFSLGSILGRFKKARVAYPGGCDIGARPVDLHIKGLRALNVKVSDKHGFINCDGKNMRGGIVSLDFPSVGATENIILAATLAKGTSEIINAAKEPEIVDLANFLNTLGAKIYGAGTSHIIVEGVNELTGGEYTPIPDRIIAGTYLVAGLITGGDIKLYNFRADHNSALLEKIKNSSCKFKLNNDILTLKSDGRLKSIPKIETSPYPGFPTDLQAQILALQTVSKGTSIIVENVFETRFKHVPELVKMGANIIVRDRTAIISGTEKLYGANVNATDLRGGVGLVLAGLVAEGYTTVNQIELIDRGYYKLEDQLNSLGADIKRLKN